MKCKSCGIIIDKDEYEAFNGRCVDCDEENQSMIEEIEREDI